MSELEYILTLIRMQYGDECADMFLSRVVALPLIMIQVVDLKKMLLEGNL